MARRLEDSLYRSASSKEVYVDMTTLKHRLHGVAQSYQRQRQTNGEFFFFFSFPLCSQMTLSRYSVPPLMLKKNIHNYLLYQCSHTLFFSFPPPLFCFFVILFFFFTIFFSQVVGATTTTKSREVAEEANREELTPLPNK